MNEQREMLKIIENPSTKQLEELHNWLKEEYGKEGEGFYSNWSIISKSYDNKMLLLAELNKQIVGFIVFSDSETHIRLDILNIKKEYQGKGYGKSFYNQVESIFSRTKLAIEGFCSPEESEEFWKKMGFIELINTGYSQHPLSYYKPLVNVLNPSKLNGRKDNYQVRLWNCEPYQAQDIEPKWVWNFNKNHDFSEVPIISPCNPNWQIEITTNGESLKKDKVKYITEERHKYYSSPFLYIKENPIDSK